MKITVLQVLVLLLSLEVYSQECKKCDMEVLLLLSENVVKPDFILVKKFVCTFDSSCISNAEYSEWSNELVFNLLLNDVDLLNRAINEVGGNKLTLIRAEIENPIYDLDFQEIFESMKEASEYKDMVDVEMKALIVAAKKEGIQLR